ncbi:MAG: hypothetical protein JWQ89_734 [Devosia sp.]|nr:hypothetical protein [Devosia sp.]
MSEGVPRGGSWRRSGFHHGDATDWQKFNNIAGLVLPVGVAEAAGVHAALTFSCCAAGRELKKAMFSSGVVPAAGTPASDTALQNDTTVGGVLASGAMMTGTQAVITFA